MSAAESQWPAWLRRHTAVELLGAPGLFFARLTIALALLGLVFVGGWNANVYPVPLGYDAQSHVDYAHTLVHDHHLPSSAEEGESNQPPLYYALAGAAAALGHQVFGWHESAGYTQLPDVSYRGALCLNILFALLTALCILWLARTVAPERPWVWAASVGFFCFLPIVTKTMAMFHPENLNLLAGAAATATVTHMLVRRDFRWRYDLLLLASLGAGLLTRSAALFTLLGVAFGIALAIGLDRDIRRAFPYRRFGALVGAALVLVLPWWVSQARTHGDPFGPTKILAHVFSPNTSVDHATDRSPFFRISLHEMFKTPYRTHFKNEALPVTYTEIWGDWIAVFAWSAYSAGTNPNAQALPVLRDQQYIGLVPTFLSLFGFGALVWWALRRRRELLPIALVGLIGVTGYLYRSYAIMTSDGDLLKAVYALQTAPVWALGFGLASGWLARRSMLMRIAMIALFAVFAVLELRFTMYGVRDHHPIF